MPTIEKSRVISLIQERELLVAAGESTAPHDYQTLKENIIREELKEELEALQEMLQSNDDFESLFRTRCKIRAELNASSALGFTEMPTGATNSLYWDIAMLLEPPTMADMINILLPDATEHIVYDAKVSKDTSSAHAANLEFSFKKEPISSLIEKPSLGRFSDFVITGTRLFDVKTLSTFQFRWHKSLHAELSKAYPDLAQRVYEHNPSLKILSERLAILHGKGQTPLEAITVLIRELRLGGTRMTGSEHAARTAQDAFAAFMGYLDALPEDTKGKLLSLSDGSGQTLMKAIDHLRGGNCVETGASYLQRVIDSNPSQAVLKESPFLTQDYLISIAKGYGSKHPLSSKAMHSSLVLPKTFLEKTLSRLEVNSLYDCISLLLSFPPTLYIELFKHARINVGTILSQDLVARIKEGVLNGEQKTAFFKAIISNPQRFNIADFFNFILDTNLVSPETIFDSLPDDVLVEALKTKDRNGKTVLHLTVNDPEFFKTILFLLPVDKRVEALKVPDGGGQTILHKAAVDDPEFFKTILDFFPEDERVMALNVRDKDGCSVLHKTFRDTALFMIMLNLFPVGERAGALKAKGKGGQAILGMAAKHPEFFKTILGLLPKNERLEALKNQDEKGQTVLHNVIDRPEELKAILDFLPKDEHAEALNAKNGQGETVLQHAADYIPTLKAIFGLFPASERLGLLKQKNHGGNTLLDRAIINPTLFITILELLPEAMRLEAVKFKETVGIPVLHSAIAHPAAFKTILSLLPEDQRFEGLKMQHRFGSTVLQSAVARPEVFITILELLPEAMRVEAIKVQNMGSKTILHESLAHPAAFKTILGLLPVAKRVEVLNVKSGEGRTVLQDARDCPELFNTILGLLPANERFEAFKVKNRDGQMLLHSAVSYPEVFTTILGILPEDTRFEELNIKNRDGLTTLQCAVAHPEVFITILGLLPEGKRVEALNVKNGDGLTVLQSAAAHPEVFNRILGLLPEVDLAKYTQLSDRLDVIAQHSVGREDILLRTYINEARTRLMNVYNPGVYEALDNEFTTTLRSVNSTEMQAVRETIHEYGMKSAGCLNGTSYAKKAQSIERALCGIPLADRTTVLTGPNNPVQEALSKGRLSGKFNPKGLDKAREKLATQPSNNTGIRPERK